MTEPREEALTRRERGQLPGYVSGSAVATRAILFLVVLSIVGTACWRLQRWLQLPDPLWLLPTGVTGVFLYLRSRRWTGGRELRQRVRQDLVAGTAVVHHVRVRDAIVFEEREDEGPIVFVLTDAGETLVFTGQDLSRDVARGFPWREFEIRESASSGRFLGLKRLAGPFPPTGRKPPMPPDGFRKLGLASVGRCALSRGTQSRVARRLTQIHAVSRRSDGRTPATRNPIRAGRVMGR